MVTFPMCLPAIKFVVLSHCYYNKSTHDVARFDVARFKDIYNLHTVCFRMKSPFVILYMLENQCSYTHQLGLPH